MATCEVPFGDEHGIRPLQEVNPYQSDAAGTSFASFDDILLHLAAKRDDATVNDLAWRLFTRQATIGTDVAQASPPFIAQSERRSTEPSPKERKTWMKRKRAVKDSSHPPKKPLFIALPPAGKAYDEHAPSQPAAPKSHLPSIGHLPTPHPTARSNQTIAPQQSNQFRTGSSIPPERQVISSGHNHDANDRIVAWRDDVLQPDAGASEQSSAWEAASQERQKAGFTRLRLTPSLEVNGHGRGLLSMVLPDDDPQDHETAISTIVEPVPLRQLSSSSTESSVSGPTLSTPSIAVDRSGTVSPLASPELRSDTLPSSRSNLRQRHISQAASFCFIGADESQDTVSMYNQRQHHISGASILPSVCEREQHDTASVYSKRSSVDNHEQSTKSRHGKPRVPIIPDVQRTVEDLSSQLSRQFSITSPVRAGVFNDAATATSKTDKPLPPPPPAKILSPVTLSTLSSLKPVVHSTQLESESSTANSFQSLRRSRLSRPFSPFELPEFLQLEPDIAEHSGPPSPVELACPDQVTRLTQLKVLQTPTELPGSTVPPSPSRLPKIPDHWILTEPPSPTHSQAEKDLLEQLSAITQAHICEDIDNAIDSPTLGSCASAHTYDRGRSASGSSEHVHSRVPESRRQSWCLSAAEEVYIAPIVPKLREHVRSESSLNLSALHCQEGSLITPTAPTRSASMTCVEPIAMGSTENLYDGSAWGELEYERPRIGMRDIMQLLRDEDLD